MALVSDHFRFLLFENKGSKLCIQDSHSKISISRETRLKKNFKNNLHDRFSVSGITKKGPFLCHSSENKDNHINEYIEAQNKKSIQIPSLR